MEEIEEIEINGKIYVKKRDRVESGKYVIARAVSAGVFAGFLESRKEGEVVLHKARRLWYWKGAASLSQLAMEGTKEPQGCKFPCPVGEVLLRDVIEIIPTTRKAKMSLESVPIWEI